MSRRQFLLGTTGALAACGLPRTRGPQGPHSLPARLRALAVSDDDFYRPVLYTWTTAKGIENLRKSRRLLTATAEVGGFTSAFIHSLVRLARMRDGHAAIAKILVAHPALIRRRYAWTAPFATVMGIGNRLYGSSLIRIELRPDAWIARFEPAAIDPFTVVDAGGAAVPLPAVLRDPERIGAVFHVRLDSPVPFREYVLCSPAMVETWAIATTEIRDKLASEVGLLRELRHAAAFSPTTIELPASASWQHTPASDLAGLWHSTLAFDNERYHARASRLDAIIDRLERYDNGGSPLVVSRQAVA